MSSLDLSKVGVGARKSKAEQAGETSSRSLPTSVKVERKYNQRQKSRMMEQLLLQILNDLIDRQTLLLSYQCYFQVNMTSDAKYCV